MSDLANTILGILFYESEALSLSDILSLLNNENEDSVISALKEIEDFFNKDNSSLNLLNHNNHYQIIVSGTARDLILTRDNKEREGELSRPALETLCSIIYLGGATKSQIDYIRGVQSSYMLRVLVSRGLVARSGKIGRDNIYIPTVETLRFLGISSIDQMPDYKKVHDDLKNSLKNSLQLEN